MGVKRGVKVNRDSKLRRIARFHAGKNNVPSIVVGHQRPVHEAWSEELNLEVKDGRGDVGPIGNKGDDKPNDNERTDNP
jgi:hypothetical protein